MTNEPASAEYDESRMTPESCEFAAVLFARFPQLRRFAAMERWPDEERWNLTVAPPAPSGDPKCQLIIYVEGGGEPSVVFGNWHTHESVWGAGSPEGGERTALLNLIEGIFTDRYVICEDIGGSADGSTTILDLLEPDALMEELTDRYSPGRVRLRSWSGKHDREVSVDDP